MFRNMLLDAGGVIFPGDRPPKFKTHRADFQRHEARGGRRPLRIRYATSVQACR